MMNLSSNDTLFEAATVSGRTYYTAHEALSDAAVKHAAHNLEGAVQLYAAVVCKWPEQPEAWDGMGIVLFQQVPL